MVWCWGGLKAPQALSLRCVHAPCAQASEEGADEDGVVWMTDTSEEAARKRAQVRAGGEGGWCGQVVRAGGKGRGEGRWCGQG